MGILENERLDQHTTFRLGGPARYFAEAKSPAEVTEALAFAAARSLPVFVLGGGSNVLVADSGYPGLVLHMAGRGLQNRALGESMVEVVAAAGEEWDDLVSFAVSRGLAGLETMSLIPGTVGGAVAGNIGAYGAEVKDTLAWVEAMDQQDGQVRRLSREECRFAYRTSHFKTPAGRGLVILRAAFHLPMNTPPILTYKEVREYLSQMGSQRPTLAQVREAVIAIRRRKLPDLTLVGTAGSFFKNPVVARARFVELALRYPGLPGHDDQQGKVKVSLGWILDKVCGLKGVRQGHAGTHPDQALVMVSHQGTTAEVEELAERIAHEVQAATGLVIEWEVERLPAEATPVSFPGQKVR
jgi:UDP-N-acetylmuramate dehydrogenase